MIELLEEPTAVKMILESYDKQDLLRSRDHSTLPLRIYCYTDKCQYGRYWDKVTLNTRSLVVNSETGQIVSQSLQKFFNLKEPGAKKVVGDISVYKKTDGRLINAFLFEGDLVISSRGSFDNLEVEEATKIINDSGKREDIVKALSEGPRGQTMCFEIVHPNLKVLIDYGNVRDLIYLCSVDQSTWVADPEKHRNLFDNDTSVPHGKLKSTKTIDDLLGEGKKGEEGYVIYGKEGPLVKIKHDHYMELARVQSHLNSKTLFKYWQRFILGDDSAMDDLMEMLPDEYASWAKSKMVDWVKRSLHFRLNIMKDYERIQRKMLESGDFSRKKFAEFARTLSKNPSTMFAMRDQNMGAINKYIIQKIKPTKVEWAQMEQ